MRSVSTTGKRPWLAAVLALLYPGLGHAYLWLWARAAIWAGLAAFVGVVVVDVPVYTVFEDGGLRAVGAALSRSAWASIAVVKSMETLDAYRQARVHEAGRSVTAVCPECGKELDGDLAFCHWCTTRLDGVEE